VPPRGINLALSTVINEADPRDAIRVLLDGIKPGDGRAGPWMPGFDGAFSDPQLAALLGYLRAHYGNGPAWPDLETELHNIRGERQQ